MNALNDYCLLHIFQYLSPTEKLVIEKVCTRWQQLIRRLWKQTSKLQFKDVQMFSKRNAELMAYETLNDLICKCGEFVQHVELENMIIMDKLVTVQLGAYSYRLLVSSLTVERLINALSSHCSNLITVSLNTTTIFPIHLQELVQSSKNLMKVKICGIDSKTMIDDYLEFLPVSIEKLDLFCIDCQLNQGLCTLIQRTPNLRDLRCVCYEANCEGGLTEEILQTISNCATRLNRLHLRQLDMRVSDGALHAIGALSNLEYLKLERFDTVISDDLVVELTSSCKKLRLVSFSGCPRLTNYAVSLLLTTLPQLEDLEIFHSNFSEFFPSDVPLTIQNLKRMYITHCPNVTQDSICRFIDATPNLITFFVSKCNLDKSTISHAILSAVTRRKIFIAKKWKALNALPFRVIITKKAGYNAESTNADGNACLRFLIYDNEGYDDDGISTNANMALFLQQFVCNYLKDCQILQ